MFGHRIGFLFLRTVVSDRMKGFAAHTKMFVASKDACPKGIDVVVTRFTEGGRLAKCRRGVEEDLDKEGKEYEHPARRKKIRQTDVVSWWRPYVSTKNPVHLAHQDD